MEHYVCQFSDLEERKTVIADINGLIVGVVLVNGQLHAYENTCPHMEGPVCLGDVRGRVKTRLNQAMEAIGEYESQDEVHIVCPWHGLEFNVATGVCIPEPKYELKRFEAYQKGEQIYINI